MAEDSNAVRQLRAYDQLPADLRALLSSSPFKLSAVMVLSAYHDYGAPITMQMVQQNIDQMLAMAEQEKGA